MAPGTSRYRPSPRHHGATPTSICELSEIGFDPNRRSFREAALGAATPQMTVRPQVEVARLRSPERGLRIIPAVRGRDEGCARALSDGRPHRDLVNLWTSTPSARQTEVHALGAPLSPFLSWRSSSMSASAVMSASSNAPCRSSLSLLSSASRSRNRRGNSASTSRRSEAAPIPTPFAHRRHGVRPNDSQVSKTGLKAARARPWISR